MNSTLAVTVFVAHGLGALSALHVLMHGRSAQGTIAWIFGLGVLPYLALPLYWTIGRSRYWGHVDARRADNSKIQHIVRGLVERLGPLARDATAHLGAGAALERLARLPFTGHNDVRLLIDGEATFGSIFDAIAEAQTYVALQFFTVRDDDLGREFAECLLRKAAAGVRVYLMYDDIGSLRLPRAYVARLRSGGVRVERFRTGRVHRFQINFRNHRKAVVIDGSVAFVGGHNVGDEYLGKNRSLSPWRDTHVRLEGPAVQGVQLAFLEDWYSMVGEVPELDWTPRPATRGDMAVLALESGPADRVETCGLAFVQAVHAARERCWIASPYFVPDSRLVAALQLAALRGVDVRVLLPAKPDHRLAWLASFASYSSLLPCGVKIWRYEAGFMHQKVMLIDQRGGIVGTANMDPRSFELNFEMSIVVADEGFANDVEGMLARDFARSRQASAGDLDRRSIVFRVAVRVARLFAPIL